jgi:hypothetical protein
MRSSHPIVAALAGAHLLAATVMLVLVAVPSPVAAQAVDAIDPADLVHCLGGAGGSVAARQETTTQYGATWVVRWASMADSERWEIDIWGFRDEAAARAALAGLTPRSGLPSDAPVRFGPEVADPGTTDALTRDRVALCLGAERWPSPTEATDGSAAVRVSGGVTAESSGLPVVPASDFDANTIDPAQGFDVTWADPTTEARVAIAGDGITSTGTYMTAGTSPSLSLALVVDARGEALSYLSADGECTVTIDRLGSGDIAGSFTCQGLAEQSGGSGPIGVTGTFAASRGTPVADPSTAASLDASGRCSVGRSRIPGRIAGRRT